VQDEPDGALGVEADQHHALPAKPVGQGSEEEAAQADPAEVQGGCQRGKIMAVTDQRPML